MQDTGNSVTLSFFRSVRSKQPYNVREFTWDQISAAFARTRRAQQREEIELVSPAVFQPGAEDRKQERVLEVTASFSDIDDGWSAAEIFECLRGYDAFCVETWNSTQEQPRWRVVARLLEPVPLAEYDAYWSRMNRLFKGHLDPATKDAGRLYYLPSAQVGEREREFYAITGQPIDWRNLPDPPAPKPTPRTLAFKPATRTDESSRSLGMLNKWASELSLWAPGGRHNKLFSISVAAGGLIAAGSLDDSTVVSALLAACDANDLLIEDGEANVRATIRDGIKKGLPSPWAPSDFGDRSTWRSTGVKLGGHRNGQTAGPPEEPLPAATRHGVPDFPLDMLPAELAEFATSTSLPTAYSVAAALGVIAIAIGGQAEITTGSVSTRHERAILWLAIVGVRASGKSTAIDRAVGLLARWHRENEPKRLHVRSATSEAFGRGLSENGGAVAFVHGELRSVLKSLGQYKKDNEADEADLMELWSGSESSVWRVGYKARLKNEVEYTVEAPTVSILGGLLLKDAGILGEAESGMRSRWLPFLGDQIDTDGDERDDGVPFAFKARIEALLDLRGAGRVWQLVGESEQMYREIVRDWRKLARDPGTPAGVQAMLERGSLHLARMCLAIAEFWKPGGLDVDRRIVPAWIVEAARAVIEYNANCWLAVDDGSLVTTTLNYRDEALSRLIRDKVLPRLMAAPGERLRHREIQRLHLFGHLKPDVLKALRDYYEDLYPGAVRQEGMAYWWCAPPVRDGLLFTPQTD